MSLRLENVAVSLPDGPDTIEVLRGVSLAVAPGEVVAVTGSSGSGKSTLMAVAGLLRRPDTGRVEIDGEDAGRLSQARRTALRRDRIGLVFQSPNLFPSLAAIEQLELVAHIEGRLDDEARSRARHLLETVGMGDRLHHRPGQLSGGERQRVGVARALMGSPSVLLADEPTASLDEDRGRAVMDLIVAQGREQHVATVIVSHNLDQVAGVDRRYELRHGILVEV